MINVEELIKSQLGTLLFSNLVAQAQLNEMNEELTKLKKVLATENLKKSKKVGDA